MANFLTPNDFNKCFFSDELPTSVDLMSFSGSVIALIMVLAAPISHIFPFLILVPTLRSLPLLSDFLSG